MSARPLRPSRSRPSAPAAEGPLSSRRGVVIAAGFGAMLLAAGTVWLALSAWPRVAGAWPIREVRFVAAGDRPLAEVDQDALHRVAAALQTRAASMLQLDLTALKGFVQEQEWVREATARRQFPSTVVVAIEEHRPFARWRTPDANEGDSIGTSSALVNTKGEVFRATISDERRDVLPALGGPLGSSAELLERFTQLTTAFAAIDRRPAALEMTPRRAWRVVLDNGATLELGRGNIDERIERFLHAYAAVPALQAAGAAVDLRYPAGFAVRGETAAAAQPSRPAPARRAPPAARQGQRQGRARTA